MAGAHPLSWLPNVLTVGRCFLAVLVGWLILADGAQTAWPVLAFIAVALTDLADGALARRWQAVSRLGTFLDPVADKLLVGLSVAAITALNEATLIYFVPAAAIIARDLIATALRLIPGVELPVSQLAKGKTALEMAGIAGWLAASALASELLVVISLVVIWLAALLAIYTLGLYLGTLLANQNDRTMK